MATVIPIWVTSATSRLALASMASLENDVMARVMGTLMLTRSGAACCVNPSKSVVVSCFIAFPVRLNGSTVKELKCRVSRSAPSRMNPRSGDAQPSPITCSQFKSISVIRTFGSVSASAIRAARSEDGTWQSTITSPSGFGKPRGASLGAPSKIPSSRNTRNKASALSAMVNSWVFKVISGWSGSSYGSSMHVKCFNSPLATLAYWPFGSRFFNSSTGTSRNTS
mmetsp:Transcript_52440/g.63182  ORF Transcript_52440/g.63182 Transcript_52440/m.63182 type:complete len:224 (-) Transcript_52440:816-1487(-)